MKKIVISLFVIILLLTSCGGKSNKKRSLDATLYKYASLIRWSNYEGAATLLKRGKDIKPPDHFQLQKLKQFKVSRYVESPIQPGNEENQIFQTVEIQLYNIHTNKSKTIIDNQVWEYDDQLKQWFLTTGLPKLIGH